MWLGCLSKCELTQIESVHYTALRVRYFDYRNNISREVLDHDFKRASPTEWSLFATSREMIRIFNSGQPERLYRTLKANSYRLKRPTRLGFYDTSKLKIGRQAFGNRIGTVAKQLDFDWHFSFMSPDSLHANLKECLIEFPSTSQNKISASMISSRLDLARRKHRHPETSEEQCTPSQKRKANKRKSKSNII